MPLASQLELSGSPFEQTSKATITYTWDPTSTGTGDLASGETPSSPQAQVLQLDSTMGGANANTADAKDVTSTVVVNGDPRLSGNNVLIALKSLTPGYVYRVILWFTGSGTNHVPSRFFHVICKV